MTASINSVIGFPSAQKHDAVEVATATSGYVPQIALGSIIAVQDPYWGGRELIRLEVGTSTAVKVGQIATWNGSFQYSAVANTANLGRNVAFALSSVASNATYKQYAWFIIAGVAPVYCGASVAADTAFGITAAGTGGAIANGKQILNARITTASTATVAKSNCTAASGSYYLRVPNSDGWFVGVVLSGTGIASGATVAEISSDGLTVRMSAVTTAAVNGTVTATYNDGSANYYNVATFDRPFAQGQVA